MKLSSKNNNHIDYYQHTVHVSQSMAIGNYHNLPLHKFNTKKLNSTIRITNLLNFNFWILTVCLSTWPQLSQMVPDLTNTMPIYLGSSLVPALIFVFSSKL